MSSSISAKQRAEYAAELRRDFPAINEWLLNMVLDLYTAEGGKAALDAVVKNHARAASRGRGYIAQKDPMPAEVTGGSIRPWTEDDDARSAAFLETVNARVVQNPAPSVEPAASNEQP